MKSRSVDMIVVIAITLVAVVLAFTMISDSVPIRILATPLVFVLPGYALTSALFPSRNSPGFVERLVFSLGLSFAIVIMGGLVLNLTPFGLRTESWALLLGAITLSTCAITFLRRRRQTIPESGRAGIGGFGFTLRQGLLFSMAAVIAAGAIAISITGAETQPHPGFTQLWILPAGGANAGKAVSIGVRNMEPVTTEYSLALHVDDRLVKVWPSIDLNPNEQWDVTFLLPQEQTGSNGPTKVEAMLYLVSDPTKLYRYVVLLLGI